MPLLSAPNITISNESFASPCGTLVHIFVGGEGAPVVALHCSGPQGQAWRGLLAELGHRFQMHCTNLYGYERSAAWCGPHDLTLSDEADLIGALIRRCNRPVHLIGHLIGHSHRGALALRIAIDHPDRLCSLSLYEPAAFHLLKPEFGGRHPAALREIQQLADHVRDADRSGDFTEAARRFIDYWNGPGAFAAMQPHQQDGLCGLIPQLRRDFANTIDSEPPSAPMKRSTCRFS